MITSECLDCRMRSVPYFGFFMPCKNDALGSHRNIVEINEDDAIVAKRLYNAYQCVQWFDRAKFDKSSGTARELLSRYCPGTQSFEHTMVSAIGFRGLKFRKCSHPSCAHYEL